MALAHSFFSLSLPLILLSLTLNAFAQFPTLTTDDSSYLQSSPSGDFKLGFRQLSDDSFLLSIWYSNIPDTIVWYAGADGVLAPKGSILCTVDQGLMLIGPQEQNTLWVPPISIGVAIGGYHFNDTGNLVIYGTEGVTLWQSFDDPRDTLLPGQIISGGPKIYSKRSKSNFTRGKFLLRMLDDGNLVLNTRRTSVVTDFAYDGRYYESGTKDANNASNSGVRGTKGYVAPEWFRNKPITVKVDVYSFGVVLLEIISCRRCIFTKATAEERVILMDWAFQCFELGEFSAFVDNEVEALDDKMRLDNFLKVALWCIQEDPNLRPTMKQVTLMIEGVIEVPTPPYPNEDSLTVSIVNE